MQEEFFKEHYSKDKLKKAFKKTFLYIGLSNQLNKETAQYAMHGVSYLYDYLFKPENLKYYKLKNIKKEKN